MIRQITNISIFLILGLLFLTTAVFAQSDADIAKKYGISFPIKELGNCGSVAECKTFCDDSKNHQSCTEFAKKHKLNVANQQASADINEEEILKLAQK